MPEESTPATGAETTESTESREGMADIPPEVKDALHKANEEAKKFRLRAKENEDAAKRLAEIEESQKTETQKLTDKLNEATRQTGETALENARLRVALRHGLTEDQARRLIGSSEDELDADAEQLKASLGLTNTEETPSTPSLPQRPREQLRSGSQPVIPIGDDDALLAAVKKKVGVR